MKKYRFRSMMMEGFFDMDVDYRLFLAGLWAGMLIGLLIGGFIYG